MQDLARRISDAPAKGRRKLVAIVGAPGSGKSTLAAALVDQLGTGAALVPMDGFHLDDRVLAARGMLARKGAPETFDAYGFVAMIQRLAQQPEVIIPVFDRNREIAIAGAQVVAPETEIAVIEGNYLLLDQAPWSGLIDHWDLSVMLDVDEPELSRRLQDRWIAHDHSPEDALHRAQSNDLPNARRVIEHSMPADLHISNAAIP